jgi:rSAM/selenodomain-associated transferase 1
MPVIDAHGSPAKYIALILVAKCPTPGRVKTRMIPRLSASAAARVHELFLQQVRRTCEQLAVQSELIDLVLLFDPPDQPAAWSDWVQWRRLPQEPGDLGRRMDAALHALAGPASAGYIFIGADAPELTAHQILWAVQQISNARYVMIPAHDGGYVLLGVPAGWKSLFHGIAWGTPQVAIQTRSLAAAHGASIDELPPIHDIDTVEDLMSLLARLARDPQDASTSILFQNLGLIIDGATSDHRAVGCDGT